MRPSSPRTMSSRAPFFEHRLERGVQVDVVADGDGGDHHVVGEREHAEVGVGRHRAQHVAELTMPASLPSSSTTGKTSCHADAATFWMTSLAGVRGLERGVRAVAHDDVADAHALEHVEDDVLAVRRRLALRRRPARGRALGCRSTTKAMPSASISGTSRS